MRARTIMKTETIVRIWLITTFILAAILISGCAITNVKELKSEEYVGKTVTVKGTAETVVKLGGLSGFSIRGADNEVMAVRSAELPKENTEVTVSGIVMKDIILGYYINAESIS